ncbi:MAG: hypothetical protein R3E39_04360 [Anaerolineae bacterium]
MTQIIKLQYDKEWLAGERVLCYRLHDLTTSTIDHWATDLSSTINEWPETEIWRLLIDIRLGGGLVNTYGLRRAREIAHLRPELPGKLAVLVGSKLAASVISMAIRATNNNYRQRQVFSNETVALRWLVGDTGALASTPTQAATPNPPLP